MIDFRRILTVYADHVGENEGVSFLHGHDPLAALSAEENAALFEAVADGAWLEGHKQELREAAKKLKGGA